MAELVSERFSSTGKFKVQLMANLTFLLHACNLLLRRCKLGLENRDIIHLLYYRKKSEYAL